jgi:GDPmannose 4,6-dehydratase
MNVLVTGVLGQDGANMVEYLLKNTNHKIYGMVRRSANPNYINIQNALRMDDNNKRFEMVYGDLTDEISITSIVRDLKPDYFINLAANSFVGCSWEMPLQVFETNTLGVIKCLEAIRKYKPTCRFYSAGSSEEFGNVEYSPQDIKHPIKPRSPYGASKAAARHIVKVYRESYGLYAIHSILFNHEGTKRGLEFVTRKITNGVADILRCLKNNLEVKPIQLGNLDTKRDWSDSEDFVDGIWRMLNQDIYNPEVAEKVKSLRNAYGLLKPIPPTTEKQKEGVEEKAVTKLLSEEISEYVLASGQPHSVREFVELAFQCAGITDGYWIDSGDAYRSKKWDKCLVETNKGFLRPAEINLLVGDSSPIREDLGWKPKTSFSELVKKMVDHDLKLFEFDN